MQPTPLSEILTALPAGLYALTGNGELGVYDAQHVLHVDAELTRAFAGHNRAFLRAYLKDPQAEERRVAALYHAAEPQAWGRLTLGFEDSALRELYPVGGRASGELTAFQLKNRAKSVYRGIELLLDAKRGDAPLYCPVLFNPHATLAERATALGRAPYENERELPVLDVLNLLATVPNARRSSPAVLALVGRLRQRLIRREARSELGFAVLHADHSTGAQLPAEEAYAEIERDKRLRRALTLPQLDARRLHELERVAPVERWLKIPHQPVTPERLRDFAQFRALNETHLAELAARSLLYTAPPGTRLLDRGMSDAWNLYLLEGALMLTPADGATLRVDGGGDKARYPVAFLKPRKYTVETLTPVSFLWVHDLLLEAVHATGPRA